MFSFFAIQDKTEFIFAYVRKKSGVKWQIAKWQVAKSVWIDSFGVNGILKCYHSGTFSTVYLKPPSLLISFP